MTERAEDPQDAGAEGTHDAGQDLEGTRRRERQSADIDAFAREGSAEDLEKILDALEKAPVEEHALVFDRLHTELRRLLDRDPSAVPQGLVDSMTRGASEQSPEDGSTDESA